LVVSTLANGPPQNSSAVVLGSREPSCLLRVNPPSDYAEC
jgi:hypothetical protein